MDGPGGISRGPREVVEGIRHVGVRYLGPAMLPFNAWLNLNGLETLSLRMVRRCSNATALARVLEKHSWVSAVSYAGLGPSLLHAIGGLTPCN